MVFTLYYVLRQLAVGTFTWYAHHEALHLVLPHTAVGKPIQYVVLPG